ncbi:unnamed protein product, partial [Vitis vinifera]|uniref:Uncharacterized protein n=1 Tax=Vitis vinifera TaxID=29760 RepID=D7TV34_VITVI
MRQKMYQTLSQKVRSCFCLSITALHNKLLPLPVTAPTPLSPNLTQVENPWPLSTIFPTDFPLTSSIEISKDFNSIPNQAKASLNLAFIFMIHRSFSMRGPVCFRNCS